jgi:uncharacterized protein YhfF
MLFREPGHIEAIREGAKTVTRRDWADNYNRPNEGSVHQATTAMFTSDAECDCFIRIEAVYQQPLGEMTDEDARAEGGYDMADFREAWLRINGEWDPEQVVDVVEFEYVGRERPTEPEVATDGGEPQAYKVRCPCGYESEANQSHETAQTIRRNHGHQCDDEPEIVPVAYVADGGQTVCESAEGMPGTCANTKQRVFEARVEPRGFSTEGPLTAKLFTGVMTARRWAEVVIEERLEKPTTDWTHDTDYGDRWTMEIPSERDYRAVVRGRDLHETLDEPVAKMREVLDELDRGEGATTDGGTQTQLHRNHDGVTLREPDRGPCHDVRCPRCGVHVAHSKGAHEGPDGDRIFGWQCQSCWIVMPMACYGARASGFDPRIHGVEKVVDGRTLWVPVVADGGEA